MGAGVGGRLDCFNYSSVCTQRGVQVHTQDIIQNSTQCLVWHCVL